MNRKNQQKRVVVQVTAAGLSSDPWAWRKYGQKPIKGSIYPRYMHVLILLRVLANCVTISSVLRTKTTSGLIGSLVERV